MPSKTAMPPKTAMALLNCCAALKANYDQDEAEKNEVAAMAQVKGDSTKRNGFAALKKLGWVTYEGKTKVIITDKGMLNADRAVMDQFKKPTSNDEHHDKIRSGLKGTEVKLFNALIDGLTHKKDDVAKELKIDPKKSTWRNVMASLVKKNIAEYPSRQEIRLTKKMFPVVKRPGDDN
ncbi:expressed unknown protein [Seminavis robusta]|uniref:Uncharacterized protein n=1 Tax=Seminavis robusta TaxID=568900 RepID=A0A9N8H501_9STRA|nr:expressed unknown protein [Seminavis robusta]|eukprot:Sro99_g050930.1 n/a (178) ;mRNA; f:71599-72222